MRKFNNPKAKILIKEADELEVDAKILEKRGDFADYGWGEMMVTAAGLRVMADDIEDGLVDEEDE